MGQELDKNELETFKSGTKFEIEILTALIEIREAIQAGFTQIDQTFIEAALMLVGCKETLDDFLEARLEGDKVLANVEKVVEATPLGAPVKAAADVALAVVKAANESKQPETTDESAEAVDEPEKPTVTIDVGDFGMPDNGSGKT